MRYLKQILNKPYVYILLLLNLITILLIIFPLFRDNPITNRDLAGHVFAVDFTKNFLGGDFQGWNPFHNLGYPQGSHYPPLFHYVISTLGQLGGSTEFWVKVLVSIALIALPYTIYYLSSKVFEAFVLLNKAKASNKQIVSLISTLIVMGLILFSPQTFGGSVRATLIIGLLTNFLAQPLLFLYLGGLIQISLSKPGKLRLACMALLLAILLLSHLVSGVFALLFTILFWIFSGIQNGISKTPSQLIKSPYFKILLIGFIEVCFFYIPYIYNTKYLTPTGSMTSPFTYSVAIWLLLGFVLCILFLKKQKLNNPFVQFLLITFAISCLPAIDALANRFGVPLTFNLIHAYRLLPNILYLGSIILIVFFVSKALSFSFIQKKDSLINKSYLFACGALVILFALGLTKVNVGAAGFGDTTIKNQDYFGSNFLTIYNYEDAYDLHKDAQFDLIRGKWNNFSTVGQFEESSYLNPFMHSLMRGLNPDVYKNAKGNPEYIESSAPSAIRQKQALDLFNIGNIVYTNNDNTSYACNETDERKTLVEFTGRGLKKINGVYQMRTEPKTFEMCIISNGSISKDYNILEPNSSTRFRGVSSADWDQEVINWWKSDENTILVENKNNIDQKLLSYFQQSTNEAPLEFNNNHINWKNNFQAFTVDLPEDKDRVSVVKVQYHPRWKAYNTISGAMVEVPIYRISPSQMLIMGKGQIEFRYEFTTPEKVLKTVSLLGISVNIIAILFLAIQSKRNSRAKSVS
jgi:hypothetical protein